MVGCNWRLPGRREGEHGGKSCTDTEETPSQAGVSENVPEHFCFAQTGWCRALRRTVVGPLQVLQDGYQVSLRLSQNQRICGRAVVKAGVPNYWGAESRRTQ